jgi:hypothetical protein
MSRGAVIVSLSPKNERLLRDVKDHCVEEWIQISDPPSIHRFVNAALEEKKILFTDYCIRHHLKNLFQCSGKVIEKRYSLPLPEEIQCLIGEFLSSRDLFHLARTSKQQGAVFGMHYWHRRLITEGKMMDLSIDDFKETTLPPECRYWRIRKSRRLIAHNRACRKDGRLSHLLYYLVYISNHDVLEEIERNGATECDVHNFYYDFAFELGKLAHLPSMRDHFLLPEREADSWRGNNVTGELNSMLMGLGYSGEEATIMSLLRCYDSKADHDHLIKLIKKHGGLDFLWEGVIKGRRINLYRTLKAYDPDRFNDTRALIVAIREYHDQTETTLLNSNPEEIIANLRFILERPRGAVTERNERPKEDVTKGRKGSKRLRGDIIKGSKGSKRLREDVTGESKRSEDDNLQIDQNFLYRHFSPRGLNESVIEFLKGYRQYFSRVLNLPDV